MEDRRLYSPKMVREILEKHNFKLSKSLGQNFLVDGNIVRSIIEKGGITEKDFILEIGPGIGTLTEELSIKAKYVVGIELDEALLPILKETLRERKNVEIIHGDILKIDLEELFHKEFKGESIKIVANLPYYITTPIIGRLLEEELNIQGIIVMIQKEVARRIIAKPNSKDYGALSIFVQYYTDPEIILNVPRSVFLPKPKVDSSVIRLNLKNQKMEVENKEIFFKVVRSAFNQRRKTIQNSLSSKELNISKEKIKEILTLCNIDPQKRAENLTAEDFAKISSLFPPV